MKNIEKLNLESDVIINRGHFGKEDFDSNDIHFGDVTSVFTNNFLGIVEKRQYRIDGMGYVAFDGEKYDRYFGEFESESGYSMVYETYNIKTKKLIKTHILISYEFLIRNFMYTADLARDPKLFEILHRERNIGSILE